MVIGKVEAIGVLMVEYIIPSAPLIAVGYKARILACLAFIRLVRAWLCDVGLPSGPYSRLALIDAKLCCRCSLPAGPAPRPAPNCIISGLLAYRFPNWSMELRAAHILLISLAVVALYWAKLESCTPASSRGP